MFLSVIEMKEKNDQYWFETSHLIGMVPACGKGKNYEKFKYAFMVSQLFIQWVPQLFELLLEFFHVYKSCKIEYCGNKMHCIIQNFILSQGLKLKLSLL